MASNVSSIELRSALRGTDFPAARDQLLDVARENDAAEDVIIVLNSLAQASSYESPRAVASAAAG